MDQPNNNPPEKIIVPTEVPTMVQPEPVAMPAAVIPEEVDSEVKTSANGKEGFRSILSTIGLILLAPLLAVLLNLFVFQSYQVDGSSMEPTLHNDNRLIVLKLPRTVAKITHHDYLPKRGTIIVFKKPSDESEQLIKRVIGLPGERVVVKDGKITVFNKERPNGFDPDDAPYGKNIPPTDGNVDVTVGEGEVFVCGDNRIGGNSLDSRTALGDVPLKNIVGELVLRIFPLNQIKNF
jgi:signal peptidase I